MLTSQTDPNFEALFSKAFNKDETFASRFLGVSVEGLRSWRKRGIGPPWRKLGKLVKYSAEGLLDWAESQPGGGKGKRSA